MTDREGQPDSNQLAQQLSDKDIFLIPPQTGVDTEALGRSWSAPLRDWETYMQGARS